MQEIVDESPEIELKPEPQHRPGQQLQPQVSFVFNSLGSTFVRKRDTNTSCYI